MIVPASEVPSCPFCGRSEDVVCLSRVRRRGKVVAERWVCKRCCQRFAVVERRLLNRAVMLAIAAVIITVPTIWWRSRTSQTTPRSRRRSRLGANFFHSTAVLTRNAQ